MTFVDRTAGGDRKKRLGRALLGSLGRHYDDRKDAKPLTRGDLRKLRKEREDQEGT